MFTKLKKTGEGARIQQISTYKKVIDWDRVTNFCLAMLFVLAVLAFIVE